MARHRLDKAAHGKICFVRSHVAMLAGSSGSGVSSGFVLVRMADAADDSAEWLNELVVFSVPAASVQVDDSAEWLRELVGFSVPAPSVQVDDSMEWLHELLGFSSVPAPPAPSALLSSLQPAAVPASSSAWQPPGISHRAGPAPSSSRRPRSRSPRGPRAGSRDVLQPAVVLQPPRRSTSQRQYIVASLVSAFPGRALDVPQQGDIVRHFLRDMPDLTAGLSAAASLDDVVAVCLGRLGCWFATFEHIIVFEFGICFDPEHRWRNRAFGYLQERMWQFMDLLFVGSPQQSRRLEIVLIAATRSVAGCQNEAPGGEGVAAGSESADPCYCYVVVAPAGRGLGLRRAFDLRVAELAKRGTYEKYVRR